MKLNVKDTIFTGIIAVILIAALCIWPLGIFKIKYDSKSLESGKVLSGPITEASTINGSFRPQFSNLNSLGLCFSIPNRDSNPGFFVVEIADKNGEMISSETVYFSNMRNGKYYTFQIDTPLVTGELYDYYISAYNFGEDPPSLYIGSLSIAAKEHVSLFYAGTNMYNNAPLAIFEYQRKATLAYSYPYLIISCTLLILVFTAWKTTKNISSEVSPNA